MRVWRWGRASSEKSKKTFGLLIRSCLRRQDIRSISGSMNCWRRRSSMSLWRDGVRSSMRLSMVGRCSNEHVKLLWILSEHQK